MNVFPAAAALVLAAILAAPAAAQHEGHGSPDASPYADLQDRAIKALSEEETRTLLAGEGMGFALAAELNGLPGPRHVLELADALALSEAQRESVTQVFEAMNAEAVVLGRRIVDGEAELDRAFQEGGGVGGGAAAAGGLKDRIVELGRLRGELRAVHLLAHLETVALLTAEQVRAYGHLRGYHGSP